MQANTRKTAVLSRLIGDAPVSSSRHRLAAGGAQLTEVPISALFLDGDDGERVADRTGEAVEPDYNQGLAGADLRAGAPAPAGCDLHRRRNSIATIAPMRKPSWPKAGGETLLQSGAGASLRAIRPARAAFSFAVGVRRPAALPAG